MTGVHSLCYTGTGQPAHAKRRGGMVMTAGPEARKRCAERVRAEQLRNRVELRARLAEKAVADPEGIWSELLAEHDAANA